MQSPTAIMGTNRAGSIETITSSQKNLLLAQKTLGHEHKSMASPIQVQR